LRNNIQCLNYSTVAGADTPILNEFAVTNNDAQGDENRHLVPQVVRDCVIDVSYTAKKAL